MSIMDLGIKRFLRKLGPGLITGASDDDPSGIATYSQAGAQFGLKTLWTALITTPLMISIQEMCARIGIVTQQGLTSVIKKNYPKSVLYFVMLISFTAVIFNIGADISAVGAVSNLLVPQVPTIVFCLLFTVLLALILIKFSYRKLSSFMKWLCLAFFAYFIVPFLVGQNWQYVITNLVIPTISLNKDFLLILVAILGTTISPYLFFWQASSEVEEMRHKSIVVNKRVMNDMKIDVDIGMLFSNVVMFFIILTTGTVLFNAHITQINTVDQAALALRPLAGSAAYLLFALGVFGAAFIAIPVLAGSLSYMYAEVLGSGAGLDKKFHQARSFYMVLIIALAVGLVMNLAGLSPIKMLIYSAVLYGLIAPILIFLILHICNNRSILAKYVNGRLSNALGIITFLIMAAVAVLFLYLQFL